MRILHFTNIPIKPNHVFSGDKNISGGGWMAMLMNTMRTRDGIFLACAAFEKGDATKQTKQDNITFFSLPTHSFQYSPSKHLSLCHKTIDTFRPHIIHVHGTEEAFGLLTARNITSYPMVISLQGLLTPCAEWYHFFGTNNLLEICRMHRLLEIPAFRGLFINYFLYQLRAKRETEIIRGNNFFMGRTTWDNAYINTNNPKAHYFHGGELLRQPFHRNRWNIKQINRHSIIFTNAGHPRKGVELLLKIIPLLTRKFPDIQLQIAGRISLRSGYGRYIRKKVKLLGPRVKLLGQLNAVEMANSLKKTHLFVSPSYIDNSPNAVCEAQLLGMPVISTYTGGVPSLIQEGKTGLFIPTGDVALLATRIEEIFRNDELATTLGKQARKLAKQRHDPEKIVTEILDNYETIIKIHESTHT